MSALAAFHAALFARLNADPGLAAYQHPSMSAPGVKTYDNVPSSARYPYITMGLQTGTALGVMAARRSTNTYQLDVWDDYAGKARVTQIHALISAALAAPLVVAGFGSAAARYEFDTVNKDPSGLQHGTYRVRRGAVT